MGHRSWGAAATGQSRQVMNRQALQHCACILKRSVSFVVARRGGLSSACNFAQGVRMACMASHAPLVLCLRYSYDATKHSCMPMRAVACAGGPDLGCTDLRCPSTSRARTQQHTRRTACTSTSIAAEAEEEGCMHASCTHALRTWYGMHSIAGHFLIPAKPKDDVVMAVFAPAREGSAGIGLGLG